MSKEFGNDKGISDGRESDDICDKDGKTHERIQRGDHVKRILIELDWSIL